MSDIITLGDGGVKVYGNVAKRLLANDMNINALRTNDTLQYDEWKEIDEAVVTMARQRLVLANLLKSRGLVYSLPNGIAQTVLQWQTQSEFEDAEIDMDGLTKALQDRATYTTKTLPLPIVHKEFEISSRQLSMSRKTGQPLDTTNAIEASRKVSEKVEELIINGSSSFAYADATLYGLLDHTDKNSVSCTTHWDDAADSSGGGEEILNDAMSMITALHDAHFFGPYALLVPTKWGVALHKDFKANSDRSIYERLMAIPTLESIVTVDVMTADRAVMFQLTPDVIQLVVGQEPMTVEWEEQGGFVHKFKVIALMVPRIKSDDDGNCGVAVLA